jgi:large subunit ribosomal protein L3
MARNILGIKLGMTQIFHEGSAVPVTVVKAGPCVVTQKKTSEKEGYDAIQVGFLDKKKNITKPEEGRFKKNNITPKRFLREFRVNKEDIKNYEIGQNVTVDIFKEGDYVNVTGLSKGRGFQGVVKRWGFKGGPGSHGSMFHRAPGGIGGRVRVRGHIWKGRRMAGHMGNETKTVLNLRVMLVDKDENILLIKGATPGANGGLLIIRESLKNEMLKQKELRKKEEEKKTIAALIAKEKAEKEKKKAPARPGGGKKSA